MISIKSTEFYKYFGDLKIRNKILLSLGTVFALLVLVAGIVLEQTWQIHVYRKNSLTAQKKTVALTDLRATVRNRLLETYDIIFIDHLSSLHKLEIAEDTINKSFDSLNILFANSKESKSIEELAALYHDIDYKLDSAIKLILNGRSDVGYPLLIRVREKDFNIKFVGALNRLVARESAIADSQALGASMDSRNRIIIIIALFGATFTVLLAYLLSKSIVSKLNHMQHAAAQITSGDFNVVVPVVDHDELSQFGVVFNEMAHSLATVKAQVEKQQNMLIANSKMSALGEMAGGVAHEINTPLATIQLLSSQLMDCVKSGQFDVKIFQDSLASIDSTVKRIANIVQGLRSFSRDSRKDPVTTSSVLKIANDSVKICEERFKLSSIDLSIVCEKDLSIACRPGEISQVLVNLLSNSFDAVENLPEKWVRIEIVELTGDVEISVIDSGPGIPFEVQEKLMQPFFTTKELGKGTGLGLSISKGLIEGHGGIINIDNSSIYTKFLIRLPKLS